MLVSVSGAWPDHAHAVVSVQGNVSPAIPSNGIINAFFYIGDSSYGQLSNGPTQAAPTPTPISVTGASNNIIIGDDAGVTGSAAFTGLGFDISVQNHLWVGNGGSGSMSMSGLSRATAVHDIVLGNFDGASGRLFVNDLGTVVQAQDDIIVGNAGSGFIQALTGSRIFAETATLGMAATGDGTVTVSGNETTWIQDGAMTIGSAGRGYMQVVNQARMETAAATIGSAATGDGTAFVSGNGSVWDVNGAITIGAAGLGKLDVNEGGRIKSTGAASLASLAGGEAEAKVRGDGSLWNVGTTLTVGTAGSGILRLSGGGRVNAGNTVLASVAAARGELSVDGAGTVLDITGTIDVGNVATAEALLSVSSGGVVNSTGILRVGAAAELSLIGGRVNAGGGLTNNGLMQGGGRINGATTNTATGEMRSRTGTSLIFGNTLSNAGLVNLDGGEIEVMGIATNTGDIDIRDGIGRFNGGLNNNSGAQLAAVGGDVDVFGTVVNAAGAQIVVGGGASAVFHDAVSGSGAIVVQPGSNILMLDNLSFTPSSMLSLSLAEESLEEDFTPLAVSGSAMLAGELNVALASEVVPQLGDSFQLMTASGGLTGTFATGDLPSLGTGLEWDLNYATTSLTLSVVASSGGATGDFDGDGDVDAADLLEWKTGFGMSSGAVRDDGDADGDGDVDGSDFLAWQRQLGSVLATPTAGAVPEPSTGVLLAVALLAGASARRRQNS